MRAIADIDIGNRDAALQLLMAKGVDLIPLPGHGETFTRWKILAAVAGRDLSLVKLFEGHTDALAILAELGTVIDDERRTWGVWCAEPPDARVTLSEVNGETGAVTLSGRKAWCSGARDLSHALVSCWNPSGVPCLAMVDLRQAAVLITDEGWHAVGMAASGSVDVRFTNAIAKQVGKPNAYVHRPGFWHGGAGIAACWYGASCGLAERLRSLLHKQMVTATEAAPGADPHRLAQLGDIDIALRSAAAVLRDAAAQIDQYPLQDAMALALRTRLTVEATASKVLALATRALGAGPLCREPEFARAAADLPVFLRQSHAERDLAALGKTVAAELENPWIL
ncbi:acyl-CoA dehydrogenase [Undibacterium sp. TJN25]|uniref:acyl-CoA dehydrogenase n=1 Tax=Undibacterium sp. TJN25 TaxID=3413056 RepID=UPI003BF3F9CE